MELWTGALSWWKCHWPDLKSAGLFRPNLSLNLKPQHINLTLNYGPINSGVLTSLLLPHLSSSLTDSLPSLNLSCHSKTDARFMQDGRKAVWRIPYVSVAFFQVQNIILLHIVLLKCPHVQIAFLKFTSCDNHSLAGCIPIAASSSFEPEIIKIDQSSHEMYIINILHF